MRLVPFHPSVASQILEWNIDPDYLRFWRSLGRHLTLEECAHLPQVLGLEVLILEDDGKAIGLVDIQEDRLGSKFSVLIDKSLWGQSFGTQATKLLEDYLFLKKMTRSTITECSALDSASIRGLASLDYSYKGSFPEMILNKSGKFETVNFYHKRSPYGVY